MSAPGDPDLAAFRHGYYSLLVSLLWREPSAPLLAALGADAAARVRPAARVDARLGDGWEAIAGMLESEGARAAETVADEYLRLFVGPIGPEVNLYESFYLTGHVFERPLAEVRDFLARVAIEKDPGYAEPEDFIAFELEVMRTLLGRQQAATGVEEERRLLESQDHFLKRHLLVWVPTAARDLAAAKSARFYRGVALLLEAFVQTELDLFRSWGDAQVRDLAELREHHGRAKAWRGPMVDFQPSVPTDPEQG